MSEIRQRLSWVDFLAPLSEEELNGLLGLAEFMQLKEIEVLVVGPKEHAQRMLLAVAGQLQVYEVLLRSVRELMLSVLEGGSLVRTTGLVPRWTREPHIKALEPSVVCRIDREDREAMVRHNPEVGLKLAQMLATSHFKKHSAPYGLLHQES